VIVIDVDDDLTRLPRPQDLHLERGLLWPREAAKPIEAPSVKLFSLLQFNQWKLPLQKKGFLSSSALLSHGS